MGNAIVVHMVDLITVHMIDGCVVVEGVIAPVASLVTITAVAVAVIDATVKTDVRAPIAVVPVIPIAIEPPVSRSPERPNPGGQHPGARHPVVSIRRVGPVAWRPQIVVARGRRLIVIGQSRRRLGGHVLGSIRVARLVVILPIVLLAGLLLGRGLLLVIARALTRRRILLVAAGGLVRRWRRRVLGAWILGGVAGRRQVHCSRITAAGHLILVLIAVAAGERERQEKGRGKEPAVPVHGRIGCHIAS
jgi:hypothetical protein